MAKKYAIVGTGGRAIFFYTAIVRDFAATAQLVAFCDTNQTRMDYANTKIRELGHTGVPTYKAADFDRMLAETQPDELIVTTIDRTHDEYIVRAMRLGHNVVSEKPMTIDAARCRRILDAVAETGRSLRVTFNYRYAPHNTRVAELLAAGAIGQVNSVHFEWLLNTSHGADYFRRWHRDRRNSGGLLVHKSTHHFDLVNFWLRSRPETVFAMADLRFYGRENAEKRGDPVRPWSRAHGNTAARGDPFALHLEDNEQLRAMYLDAEGDDGYQRDQNVFGDGISIDDTMGVMVRYRSGAVMTYSLTAYSPGEGFRVVFNGSGGRLEVEVVERSYINSGGEQSLEGALESRTILLRPLFGKPELIEIPEAAGGHGGGDPELLNDIFGVPAADPLNRAASHVDGALSILTGIAANKSISTGQPVRVDDLVDIP